MKDLSSVKMGMTNEFHAKSDQLAAWIAILGRILKRLSKILYFNN